MHSGADGPGRGPAVELVALYDPDDPDGRVVGSAPRPEVRARNLPHAATAVLVRDASGRVYVHRRTDTKDLFPGAHDVWAGGVITAGEAPDDAAVRELGEELGLDAMELRPLFRSWYADDFTTYLAFAYETVYEPGRDGPIRHQAEEVADGWWWTLVQLQDHLADPQWPFVPDGRFVLECYLDALDRCPDPNLDPNLDARVAEHRDGHHGPEDM